MLEETDYEQLLGHLEDERENIDRLIVWVKGKMAQQEGTVEAILAPAAKPSSAPTRFPRLAQDSFFRMTVPDAIKKYLNMVKRPKTAKDITAALDSGGLTHQAKNLYATVYPTLLRMEKNNEVVRVGKGEWALSEWYPGGRKSNQEEKTESES